MKRHESMKRHCDLSDGLDPHPQVHPAYRAVPQDLPTGGVLMHVWIILLVEQVSSSKYPRTWPSSESFGDTRFSRMDQR